MSSSDISGALQFLCPGAQWVLQGDDISGLQWLDKVQVQPTPAQIQGAITTLQQQQAAQATAVAQAKTVLANAVATPQQQIQALRTILGL